MSPTLDVYSGDNLPILQSLPDGLANLIYIDPPFNTGGSQRLKRTRSVPSESGARIGFYGKRYTTTVEGVSSYADAFDDYLGFLAPRLEEACRLLADDGSLFVHLDYREVHYVKVLLDGIMGRSSFINEIVWAYDYGARSKRKWPAKHDTILWYARDPERYTFDFDAMDRIPYMTPGLVTAEKAARGKTPTDVWWHTIVPTNSRERTGYPTQKPLGILRRIVNVHSREGETVLDFFAGSGTTGEAALGEGRNAILIDSNEEAIAVIMRRLERYSPTLHVTDG